jgi:PKD repeat protein
MKKLTINLLAILTLGFAAFLTSCTEDEDPIKEPVASFTVVSETIAKGEAVIFTNTSTDATSFQWSFGDGETSTEKDPTHTFTSTGKVTVTLIATGAGGKNQTSKEITVGAEAVAVYFTDNTGDVFTVKKLTGIGETPIVETAFSTTGYSINIIYDAPSGKVYYSDDDNGQIVSLNLDGSGQVIIKDGLSGPRGLALNEDGTILFVVERGLDQILAITLSDKTSKVLYTIAHFGIPAEDGLLPEAIAFYDGNLYITAVELDAESVWTAKADGSSTTVTNLLGYGDAGYGYSIVVDAPSKKLFFDNSDSNEILTSGLDGSGVKKVVSTTDKVYGLAISSGKLYFLDRFGLLKRSNIDGTGAEDLSVNDNLVTRGLFVVKTN